MRPTAMLRQVLGKIGFHCDSIHKNNPGLRQMAVRQVEKLAEREKGRFKSLGIVEGVIK